MHGFISPDYAQEIERQVDQAYLLMTEIERALKLDDTDQFQDMLRTLKPKIDELNRAGLWNGHLASSKGMGPGRWAGSARAVGSTRKVWLAFRDWWRRWSHYQGERHGERSYRD